MSETISPKEFARLRGLPLPSVYRHIREGWLPVTRAGRSIRIDRDTAVAYELPVGVMMNRCRGYEHRMTRSDMLWGAAAASYVGAHGAA